MIGQSSGPLLGESTHAISRVGCGDNWGWAPFSYGSAEEFKKHAFLKFPVSLYCFKILVLHHMFDIPHSLYDNRFDGMYHSKFSLDGVGWVLQQISPLRVKEDYVGRPWMHEGGQEDRIKAKRGAFTDIF